MTEHQGYHFYMAQVCAETGQFELAEYHRLKYEAEQLQRRLDSYSIFHPQFWVLLIRCYRHDARLYSAWRKTQTHYGGLP